MRWGKVLGDSVLLQVFHFTSCLFQRNGFRIHSSKGVLVRMSLRMRFRIWACGLVTPLLITMWDVSHCQETAPSAKPAEKKAIEEEAAQLPPLSKGWKPLGNEQSKNRVWIHPKKKHVAVDGEVCLTRGYLEMFACIENTKEHESIVAVKSKAFVIHTALLAVGAKPGAPANWRPNSETMFLPAR